MSKQVDWKKLTHATGPATRVPTQVQALVSSSARASREAFAVLDETLYAAGKWSDGGVAAIPLLFDAADQGSPSGHQALWLVAEVVAGKHLHALEGPLKPADAFDGLAAEAQNAALEHADFLFECVDKGSPAMRAAAVFVLGFLPRLWERSEPVLTALLASAEPSRELRATAMLSLATLLSAVGTTRVPASLTDLVQPGSEPIFRAAFALSVAIIGDQATLSTLESPFASLPSFERCVEFPWFSGNLDAGVYSIARRYEAEVRGRFGLWLAEGIPRCGPITQRQRQVWAGSAMLLAGFVLPWEADGYVDVASLSDAQRELIAALDHPDVETEGCGLPAGLRERRRWLGVDTPGPLERSIAISLGGKTLEGQVWWVWRQIYRDELDDGYLPEAIREQCASLERIECLVEVGFNAYDLGGLTPNDWEPAELESVLSEAGADLVPWAEGFADRLATFVERSNTPHEFRPVALEACVLLPLVRAKRAFKLAWEVLVDEESINARELLSAITPERREALVFQRLGSGDVAWFAKCIELLPIVDLVPSRRIAERLATSFRVERDRYKQGRSFEQAVAALTQLEALGNEEPEVAAGLRAAASGV